MTTKEVAFVLCSDEWDLMLCHVSPQQSGGIGTMHSLQSMKVKWLAQGHTIMKQYCWVRNGVHSASWPGPSVWACIDPRSYRNRLFREFSPHSALWAIIRLTRVPLPWPLNKWPLRTQCWDIYFAAITGDEINAQRRADGPFPHPGWHTLGFLCFPEILTPTAEKGSMTNSSESTFAASASNVSNSSNREAATGDMPRCLQSSGTQ